MRQIGLALLVAALGAGATAHAQDGMMQKLIYRPTTAGTNTWAARYDPEAAATEAPQYQPPPSNPGPPVAAEKAGPAAPVRPSCAGACARDERSCREKLKAWLCYRPLGCACNCARGCCFPPAYLYFLDFCPPSNQVHALPCCYKEGAIIRGIINNHGHLPEKTDHGCCGGAP